MKYWSFKVGPYFMVYGIIPTQLGRVSSPINRKQPCFFFIGHLAPGCVLDILLQKFVKAQN